MPELTNPENVQTLWRKWEKIKWVGATAHRAHTHALYSGSSIGVTTPIRPCQCSVSLLHCSRKCIITSFPSSNLSSLQFTMGGHWVLRGNYFPIGGTQCHWNLIAANPTNIQTTPSPPFSLPIPPLNWKPGKWMVQKESTLIHVESTVDGAG